MGIAALQSAEVGWWHGTERWVPSMSAREELEGTARQASLWSLPLRVEPPGPPLAVDPGPVASPAAPVPVGAQRSGDWSATAAGPAGAAPGAPGHGPRCACGLLGHGEGGRDLSGGTWKNSRRSECAQGTKSEARWTTRQAVFGMLARWGSGVGAGVSRMEGHHPFMSGKGVFTHPLPIFLDRIIRVLCFLGLAAALP